MFEIVERILAALIILALLTLLIILAFPVSAPSPGPARTTTEVKPGDNQETERRVTEVKAPPGAPKADPKTTEPKPDAKSTEAKSTEPKPADPPKSAERLPEQRRLLPVAEPKRPTTNLQAKTDSDRIAEIRADNRHRAATVRRDPLPPKRKRRIVERDCADDSCEECEVRHPRRRRYAANPDRPYWAQQHGPYWAAEPIPAGACPD